MLTTLDRVKAELRQSQDKVAADASEEAFILERIDEAVDRIQIETRRQFSPRFASVDFEPKTMNKGGLIVADTLFLLDPLQELRGVTIDGTELDLQNLKTLPVHDQIWRIQIERGQGWLSGGNIAVTGVWGYRSPVGEGWIDSLDTLQADISESDVTLTVSAVSDFDSRFYAPRFSPGQMIRLGDEYLQVRQITDNTLGVIRGVNGTTATAHTSGEPITAWYPEPAIIRAATRWATFMYRRRAHFQTMQIEGMTAIEFPDDAPPDVAAIMTKYRKVGGIKGTANRA